MKSAGQLLDNCTLLPCFTNGTSKRDGTTEAPYFLLTFIRKARMDIRQSTLVAMRAKLPLQPGPGVMWPFIGKMPSRKKLRYPSVRTNGTAWQDYSLCKNSRAPTKLSACKETRGNHWRHTSLPRTGQVKDALKCANIQKATTSERLLCQQLRLIY